MTPGKTTIADLAVLEERRAVLADDRRDVRQS
jgi:hypothetical protein